MLFVPVKITSRMIEFYLKVLQYGTYYSKIINVDYN
jgi:hypothetical protein